MSTQEELIGRLTRFYREAGGEISSMPPVWVAGNRRTVRGLLPVLASIMLVALAVGLAVTLRIAREPARQQITPVPTISAAPSSSPSSSATPSPSSAPSATSSWVTRHLPFGQVTAMSLDAAAIFALYAPNPVSGGIDPTQMRLARIDRTTGALTTAGPFPNAWQLTLGASGLWLAAGSEQWAPSADTQWLTLLDPATFKIKQRVRLPGSPDPGTASGPQLAGTSNLLWLAYGHSLYRLDPTTGRVLLIESLPGTVTSISIDPSGRRLYAGVMPSQGSDALVIEWDASTGARVAAAPTGGAGLGGPQVAAAPDGVWIAYATGMMGAVEHRADTTLSVLVGPQSGHTNGIRITVGGGALWLVDGGAGRLACADLRTGTIGASSQETLPAVVVADTHGSYLGEADGVGFLRPDASCPH